MLRRVLVTTLGACALLVPQLGGLPAASAVAASGPTAPDSVSFGTVKVNWIAMREVTVTVPADSTAVTFGGEATIEPFAAAPQGVDDFFVDSDTCSLQEIQPGGSCTVSVSFMPMEPGLRQAQLSIPVTSPASTLTVQLSGTGELDATGTYYGLNTPTRFLDTRTSGTKQPLAAGVTTSLQIGGRSTVPTTGVSAVVFNLTAVATTASGYLTAFPSDRTRPTASSINFPKAWTGANMVTVPVGADGKVKIYNHAGSTHVVVDVLGWYAQDDTVRAGSGMGAQFTPTYSGDPERIFDSRSEGGVFYSGDSIEFTSEWPDEASASALRAYAVNITAVGATSRGVLTAWAGGALPKPNASVVNYEPNITAPNMAVVPAGHYSSVETGFAIQNTGGTTNFIVDLVGMYVADNSFGLRFTPLAPKRILDTRNGTGLSGAFGAGQTRTLNVDSVTTLDSFYVVGNSTGILPTASTFLTVWSGDSARPTASNLNVSPGRVRSVSTYAPLSFDEVTEDLSFDIYNRAGSMHVVFDAAGTFDMYWGVTEPLAAPALGDKVTSGTEREMLDGRDLPRPGARTFDVGTSVTTTQRG